MDVLFDDAGGDVVAAKKLAGYGDNSSTTAIVEALKDEIAEKTRTYFARTAPKAAVWLYGRFARSHSVGHQRKNDSSQRRA